MKLKMHFIQFYPIALAVLFLFILFISCDSTSVSNDRKSGTVYDTESEWLVAEHEVLDGGPGKDGIPPIENPKFSVVTDINFIPDERRVLGIIKNGEVLAYPHQILDWHEIVNDDSQITITYCPLTATGIAWNPTEGPDFGTSGLIYRNNLVAYDRKTGSLWSQMRLRSINGEHLGASIKPLNILDTTWKTWKKMYPDSKILNTNTGHTRDYTSYAYGHSYQEIDGVILFPTQNRQDTRLNDKTRVHGIFIEDELNEESLVRVYQISEFDEGIQVINDQIEGNNFVIIGSSVLDFAIAYKVSSDDNEFHFEAVQDELPIIMKDRKGTKWNIFGEAVEGPQAGLRLQSAKSYTGFWFAFRDMFTLPEIYEFEN